MLCFILLAQLAAASTATAPPVDRHFSFCGFNAVDLDSSDTVRIVPGAAFSMIAKGDPRATASLAMDVCGETLGIYRWPGHNNNTSAIVTVAMPRPRAAPLSGSGAIDAGRVYGELVAEQRFGSERGRLPEPHARQVRGSCSITAYGRADRVAIDLGGSGTVTAIVSSAASIIASGFGSVRVTGHAACAVLKSGMVRVTSG